MKKKDGIAMVIFFALWIGIIAFLGIVIDCGNLMLNYSKAKTAARYAAYSGGAVSVPVNPGSNNYEIKDWNKAKNRAEEIYFKNVTGSKNDGVNTVVISGNNKKVIVNGSRKVKILFIKMLGGPGEMTIKVDYTVKIN